MRAYAIALCAALLLVAFDILSAPALFLRADGDTIVLVRQIRGEAPLTIRFIHSVRVLPLYEMYPPGTRIDLAAAPLYTYFF